MAKNWIERIFRSGICFRHLQSMMLPVKYFSGWANHSTVYNVYNTWTECTRTVFLCWCIKTLCLLYLIFIHFNVRLKRCDNGLNWNTFIILLICMNSSKSWFRRKLCCQCPFLLVGKFLDFKILWHTEVRLQKWESADPKMRIIIEMQ